jgi:AsmA protein
MKKLLIGLAALVVVIVIVVVVTPFLINWNSFKPDIADAVREATGRELAIDGDIEVSLGTTVAVNLSGVRLSNAPGAATPEMMSVGAVQAQIQLIPLLSREVVVPTLIVSEPALFLEVDAQGKPNWVFDVVAPPPAEPPAAAEGAPVNDLRLGDVRIEKGLVSYIDASSGQAIQARDIDITVALADIASALTVDGKLSLNDEPVTTKISLESPGKVLAAERFSVSVAIGSKHLTFDLNGGVLQKPVPGFDGTMALDIASVGALAAWLGQPLADDQPDPGPLSVTAELAADGAKAVLKEALIKGKALEAKASGSVDASGEVMKVALTVESGLLDVDKYLPPRERAASAPRAAETADGGPANPLEALPDAPIDLTPLRQTEADIKIAMAGIRAMGFEVGKIAFGATLKGGVLEADLAELRLYGGIARKKVRLDASGEVLAITVDAAVDKVKMDALSRAATGEVAVTGVASATVKASTTGASPRALAQALSGRIALKLGGIDVKNAPAGAISALDLTVDLPDIETSPTIKGFVVYNKERVNLDVTVDPLQKVLAEDRFALDAAIKSKRVNAGYKGMVQQRPLPGLDGDFDLDIPSVGRLAAWLGQPLDKAQPDPGPLKVQAAFAADGGKVVLEKATIQGKALDAKANGSFDMSGEVKSVVLNLETGVLDIDRYLPPPAPAEAPAAAPAAEPAPMGDPLAALPAEPLDLSALKQTNADVKINVGGIKAMGYQVGKVALAAKLAGGVLDADLAELRLYDGNVTGKVNLDAAGQTLKAAVDFAVSKVNVGALARAAMDDAAPVSGIADATLKANVSGANPRALAESLVAKLSAQLGGVDVKAAPAAISELAVDIDLPGLDAPPTIKGAVVYNAERVSLDLSLDPLKKVLGGERFALKAALTSSLVSASYDGGVQQKPVPGLDGGLGLDIPSVGKLAAWLGQPLPAEQPDPGPLALKATFAADGAKAVLKEATITGKAVKATANGSFDGGGKVPEVIARLNLQELDLDAYLPPEKKEEAPAKPAAEEPSKGWSEEPFDLAPLGQANADIAVQTGPVKYKGLVIEKSRLTVVLRNSVLKATIEELALAGGNVGAAVNVDGAKGKLGLDYALSVKNVEAQPVLIAFADSDKLSGKMNLETKGQARGGNQLQVVKTLNGNGSLQFLDGAINGINLAETLRSAGSLGFGEKGPAQKTDFAELGGTFTITNGVVDNRDFKMLAPLVRIAGAGVVPMPPRTVDYGIEAKLVATTEGQGGENSLAGLPIPIKVTGSWDNPSYNVDWASVFKQAALDPERLKSMSPDLQDAAKGFGVPLAIPGLPGTGGEEGGVGGVLKTLPGVLGGGAAAPAPATTAPAGTQATQPAPSQEETVKDTLKGVLAPGTEQGAGEAPGPAKALKGLFGGD